MAQYTEEDYIKVAKDYIKEKYNMDINCRYRVVIDNSVFIYIDQLAYEYPISTLDSVILIDKETKEIIHANLRIKTEIFERNADGNEPLPLEEVPQFINNIIYNGKYKIDTDKIKVTQKKKYNNIYDIENVPFVLQEDDAKIEIEKLFEPITKNNRGNVYELSYFIKYTDEDHNTYNIILFAYTRQKERKKEEEEEEKK
ncbi:hypothetical protein PIROE2DRAFT_4408 [Piromyces sp. E2]|nr:hypothetical protein PIROE2DRAFT_4408 [Piromyces sp. E2]|eukprot:OUM67991.1 hypothetical protein PIROE2DRAFT_4408 [Piromyces sp. E2]